MIKVTVDTNVLISATFWYGDSYRVIELVENKKLYLVLSKDILKEYAWVLQYEEIQEKIKKKNLEMKYTVLKIAQLANIVEPRKKFFVVEEDPDDNMIIECAIEGNVDFIISQDKHLLGLEEFKGIKIVTPNFFIKKIFDDI